MSKQITPYRGEVVVMDQTPARRVVTEEWKVTHTQTEVIEVQPNNDQLFGRFLVGLAVALVVCLALGGLIAFWLYFAKVV